jgi:hypothetical protein
MWNRATSLLSEVDKMLTRSTIRERDVQTPILNVLRRLPFVRVDRNQTGMLPNPDGQLVPFGSKGSADILVCVAPIGRLLGLECKVPGRKQTPAQLAWARDIIAKGGFAYRVDDLESACEHVLFVYEKNLLLLALARQITHEEFVEKFGTAKAQMAEAKVAAAEVQAKKKRRRAHMPSRGKLPPGTNRQAGI